MKIKEIRIAGFRGIPPVENPPLMISIGSLSGNIKDLLLFGPNAYGKSSVADAIEWFFKEKSRGSIYFKEYNEADNAHVHLGTPSKLAEGYIELDVLHEGQQYTLRKAFDKSGKKCSESLAGLDSVIEKISDEVVVLDHDQFRSFVSGADKEKWATFASLIGFEELEHFRAGLESVLRKSTLEEQLGSAQLDRGLKEILKRISSMSDETARLMSETTTELPALQAILVGRVSQLLTSIGMPTLTSFDDIKMELWQTIRAQTGSDQSLSNSIKQVSALHTEENNHKPMAAIFHTDLAEFEQTFDSVFALKASFDKQVLKEFYEKGIDVLTKRLTEPDACPFCGQAYEWSKLKRDVEKNRTELRIDDLVLVRDVLLKKWSSLRTPLETKFAQIQKTRWTDLAKSAANVKDLRQTEEAFSLNGFDQRHVEDWIQSCREFADELERAHDRIQQEQMLLESQSTIDPYAQIRQNTRDYYEAWVTLNDINQKQAEVAQMEKKLFNINSIVSTATGIAAKFRTELDDFSGRVAQEINTDVDRYYDALHFDDGVKPSLRVKVSGNRKIVELQCDYKGIPDKAAVTLLSESHRNSLGLAIFLAFMQFKRKQGTPIEFIVFDDVTQSFDTGHRANLINLLDHPSFPEIRSYQFLFLTHDRTLADFICRQDENSNWQRYDIVAWQLHAMRLEPYKDIDYIAVAHDHLSNGDHLAAAIYGRHGVELLYRSIVEAAGMRMPYNAKPWTTKLDTYFRAITDEVESAWDQSIAKGNQTLKVGIIDPGRIHVSHLSQGIRILHSTVHDSDFLDNPPSAGDIQNALMAISTLRDMFTCPNCKTQNSAFNYFGCIKRDPQGNPPKCKKCKQPLPCDL
jgi:hypothetical protein